MFQTRRLVMPETDQFILKCFICSFIQGLIKNFDTDQSILSSLTKKGNKDSEQLVHIIVHICVAFGAKYLPCVLLRCPQAVTQLTEICCGHRRSRVLQPDGSYAKCQISTAQ